MTRTRAGILLAAFVSVVSSARSQCASCRITLTPLVTVGDTVGDGSILGDPSAVVRDSRGRIIVADPWGRIPANLLVFAPSGQFDRSLGRVGDGPGEYRMPRLLLNGPGDSVGVLDPVLNRWSILTPDLSLGRTVVVPPLRNALLLQGPILIGEPAIRDPLVSTPVLVRVTGAGRERPLSDAKASKPCMTMLQCVARDGRALAASGTGGFWSIRTHGRYELERRDSAGVVRLTLQPRVPWFAPYDSFEVARPGRVPQTSIVGAWEDSLGRVWIVGRMADRNWRSTSWSVLPAGEGPARSIPDDNSALYDGFVDVIDGRTGTVVAHVIQAQPFHGVAAPGVPYVVSRTDDGFVRVHLYLATLNPGRPS